MGEGGGGGIAKKLGIVTDNYVHMVGLFSEHLEMKNVM